MSSPAFTTVDLFEARMAEFAGAKYGVAVASCTDALFLSLKYVNAKHVIFPARTYISAVAAAIHAGATIQFDDYEWEGMYPLDPYEIYDSAIRMCEGMYAGGFYCVSFQASKRINIGRGGMILTDDEKAVKWFKRARHDGRNVEMPFMKDQIDMLGWNCYMTPEQAARGLQLMEIINPNAPDLDFTYPDLRQLPVFQQYVKKAA